MTKYLITIAYDGTNYSGWQNQPNGVSIQSLIEQALSTIVRSSTAIVASGRTDAGVHARAQVAHFETEQPLNISTLLRSLNGLLPPDIRILQVEEAPEEFHARFTALSKEYHYHIHLNPVLDPFKRLYAYHYHAPLDIDLMEAAAKYFVGTHDFTSFANSATEGSAGKDPVRTITRLDICLEPGGIRLEFEGDGFLYKMVRNITGTLLDVARGKLSLDEIPRIFAAKDRSKASPAAPSRGLFLIKVNYPQELQMRERTESALAAGDDLRDRSEAP
jgi:tRNA pseudouridine38-40 synthase